MQDSASTVRDPRVLAPVALLILSATPGSKKHAEESIDASIERLGTKPDAWALHRVDKKVGIEESVSAMEAARRAGKCKFIGLSEVDTFLYQVDMGSDF